MPEREYTLSQRYAIGCTEKDLLLSAGAGSGKTATLTERVCRLVTDGERGVDVSRILVVTFTKAAAEELRSRVRGRLEREIASSPSPRLSKQLVALDGADISTISAFFLKSIRPYFSELGLEPSFTVADEATVKVMRERLMSDVIDDFFDEGSDSFIALADALSSSRDETSMNENVIAIANRLSSKGFYPEQLAKWASEIESDAGRDYFASPHGKITLSVAKSFGEHYLNEFHENGGALLSDPESAKKYGASLEEHTSYIERLLDLARGEDYGKMKDHLSSFSASRLPPLKSDKKTAATERHAALKKEFKDRLTKDVASMFRYSPEAISEVQMRTAALLRELARVIGDFEERFSAEKRERGIVDYTDIENFAHRIFVSDDGTPTEAASELASKYDYIFIDEYQDTNAVQDDVFSAIAASVPRFMVGDVKQSIYAFRGAEPSVFVSYRDTMPQVDARHPDEAPPGGRHTLFMSENFRSDSTVIDFVNLVSGYMFPGTSTPFEDGDRLIYSKTKPDGGTEHKAELALIQNSDGSDLSDAELEGEYIAERVVSLISGESRTDGSPIKPGDVAILLRSALDAGVIESALRRRGVSVSDRATSEFFEQKEILLMLSLLNTIDNPLRDIYLAGAIKSPAFGFSLEDVVRVRLGMTSSPLWDCVSDYALHGGDAALAEKCRTVVSFVRKYSSGAATRDPASLILSLYDEFSLLSMTDASGEDSARSAAIRDNLMTLYDMARRYSSSSFDGLYGFISYLGEMMERSLAAEKADDGCSVSIMTIHKSKGLEFPVVILARCSKKFNTRDLAESVLFDPEMGPAMKLRDLTGLVKCDNPLRAAISKKMKYNNVCEEMRVLYVAMTRASERLIVCVGVKDADGAVQSASHSRRSAYSALCTSSFADVILPPSLSEEHDFLKVVKVNRGAVSFTAAPLEGGAFRETKKDDFLSLYKERCAFEYPRRYLENIPAKVTVSKLSPSLLDDEDVVSEIDVSGAPAAETPSCSLPPLRLDDGATGAERGTATHVFLQFCDFDLLGVWGFDAELERLKRARFLTEEMANLVNRGEIEAFAAHPLMSDVRAAAKVYREFRFNVSLPASSFTKDASLASELSKDGADIIVQGVVDLAFESADGTLTLIDYKTDRLSDYEIAHPEEGKKKLALRHRSQLTYYKMACERIFEREIDRVQVFSLALGDTVDID